MSSRGNSGVRPCCTCLIVVGCICKSELVTTKKITEICIPFSGLPLVLLPSDLGLMAHKSINA